MKNICSIFVALSCLFLAACSSTLEPAGTEAPTTPITKIPTLEVPSADGVPVDEAGLAELQELFADYNGWYSRILTSDFEAPAQIDLYELFYKGIPGADNTLQAEERAYLETVWSEFEFRMDAQRIPAEEMDEVLQQYLGVLLAETDKTGLERFTFWEAGNCYYLAHGDTNIIQPLLHSAYIQEDGTVAVYYSNGNFDANAKPKPEKVAVLQPQEDGYRILSNGAA